MTWVLKLPPPNARSRLLREVVAWAGTDGEFFLVDGDDDGVVAAGVGIGGGVANVVLGVEFAADFVDGFSDGAIAEGGEMQTASGGGSG